MISHIFMWSSTADPAALFTHYKPFAEPEYISILAV